jgi:DNA-3-methyladenine glycosylase II
VAAWLTAIDLAAFYRLASCDADLGPLAHRFRGMKPPRFPSVFEGIVNAIACQQLTLTVGIHLLNRLAENHGLAADTGSGFAFPRPQDLAHLAPETLRPLGFSRQKSRAIIGLAQLGTEGHAELEGLAALPDEEALARLRALRGLGRWTAEYVLLRRLGRLSVFPGDDVGARNNLQHWLGLVKPLNYTEVGRILARWRPYNGLVFLHLLLDRLAEAGHVQAGTLRGDPSWLFTG